MKSSVKLTLVLCILLLLMGVGCSNNQGNINKLDLVHDNFYGIKWGEDFAFISQLLVLVKTKYGGNDKMPAYQVLSDGFSEYYKIPVLIYFQFANAKLHFVHIRADKMHGESLVSAVEESFGKPKARPSKDTAVWQDGVSTILMQKGLENDDYLLSIVNNENYLRLTGKKVHLY